MWYVGLDLHLDTTVVSVRNRVSAVTKRLVVASNRAALKHALRDLRGKVRIDSWTVVPEARTALLVALGLVLIAARAR